MIFIYPAIVSKNVNRSIVPVICKLLEQYYLEQIKLSFVHGKLKLVAKYPNNWLFGTHKNDIPGVIQLEAIKVKNKNVIKEGLEDDLTREQNRFNSLNKDVEKLNKDISYQQNALSVLQVAISGGGHNAPPDPKYAKALQQVDALNRIIDQLTKNRDSLVHQQGDIGRNISTLQKTFHEKEKAKHPYTGKYEAVAMDAISLKPTIETIEVNIRYIGRPIDKISDTGTLYGGSGGGESTLEVIKSKAKSEYTVQMMPVGVKVIPYTQKVKGRIEDMLLSDYYASAFTSFLKWFWRAVGWITFQKAFRWLLKGFNWAPSIVKAFLARGVDPADDSIYRSMLFKGADIDASNFSSKPDQPGHSYYGASMAILTIEDLIPASLHEEQNNFFDRPEKFRKLFRLGWNSFVVINEEERTFYFMSALEGGAVMNVPFSLMFETLKLGKYEEGLETQGKYKPRKSMKMLGMFRRMKVGQGLVSFKNLLRKKIAIREHVNNLMNKFGIKMLTEEKINKKLEKYSI